MSAPPPKPTSFSSSHHPVRHYQHQHQHHHHQPPSSSSQLGNNTSTNSTTAPLSTSSSAAPHSADGSTTSSTGTHASVASTSSYHHSSSYATAPSETPHRLHTNHSLHQQHHHLSTSLGGGGVGVAGISNSSSSTSLAHMARLQSHFSTLAPSCAAHLADQNAIPILSTTPRPSSPGLCSLSQAFVTAHDTASRLGLGVPLRVTLTTGNGAAVIQTGTLPEMGGSDTDEDAHGGYRGMGNGSMVHHGEGVMLVGTVIAPGDRLAEARIASWGVEEVARKFQKYMSDGK